MGKIIMKLMCIGGMLAALAVGISMADNTLTAAAAPLAETPAKVILKVESMSCGGCITTIRKSLAGMAGVGDVQVSLEDKTVQVVYDPQRLSDVNRIAGAVTDSGYPAEVVCVISAHTLAAERRRSAERAKDYIASVGGHLISRADFNTEVEIVQNRYRRTYGKAALTGPRGEKLTAALKGEIARRMVNRAIMIQEIEKAKFEFSLSDVDQAFERFLSKIGKDKTRFQQHLRNNGGSLEVFMETFRKQARINAYLEETVFEGAGSAQERRQRYVAWFSNAKMLAPVVCFDPDIERLMQPAPQAGSCCALK